VIKEPTRVRERRKKLVGRFPDPLLGNAEKFKPSTRKEDIDQCDLIDLGKLANF
jgi:hypothetical protein